jgi:hypothetical protein
MDCVDKWDDGSSTRPIVSQFTLPQSSEPSSHQSSISSRSSSAHEWKDSLPSPLLTPQQTGDYTPLQSLANDAPKPFACSLCSRRFRRRIHLKRHIRIHRPFVCNKCGRRFSHRDYLARHAQMHDPGSIDMHTAPPPLPPPPGIRDLESGYDAGWIRAISEASAFALPPINPKLSMGRRSDSTLRSDPMAVDELEGRQNGLALSCQPGAQFIMSITSPSGPM